MASQSPNHTAAKTLHVAPDGGQASRSDGSRERPLSLTGAQEVVRHRRVDSPDHLIEVLLQGGVYALAEPLIFTAADSGTPSAPVRWLAAPGERPEFSAAAPLTDWHRLDHELPGLPPAARDRVWYTEAPAKLIRTLYDADGLLTRAARGPLTSDPERNQDATQTTLYAKPDDLHAWPNPEDIELFIKPLHVWEAQFLSVTSIEVETGRVTTKQPGTYKLIANGKQTPPPQYWLENVPEGLDAPGRWLLDSRCRRLYLYPRGDGPPSGILAPRLTEMVRFEPGPDGTPCRHLAIEGVTFRHGDRLSWPQPRRALQHDWQLYDWPDAMVRLRGARDIAIRDCRFADAGATGLRMDGFAVGNAVEGCVFEALGGNAVAIVGDEPGLGERTHHNRICGNRIRDVGRLWWQASGILVAQASHTVIADNHLSELPYCGITLISGREAAFAPSRPEDGVDGNVIHAGSFGASPRDFPFTIGHLTCRHNAVEHNEVHDVMQRMGDGNGIYVSGTGWGNIVRGNYVHDIPAAGVHSGIRLDDMQWYTRIEGNVVCRVNGAGITLKDVNDVTDNIVVACSRPAAMLVRRSPAWGANIRRNIFVVEVPPADGAPVAPPAPFYGGGGFGGRLEEPNIDDNLLWCAADPAVAERCLAAMHALGRDLHSRVADPLFRAPERDDYRLRNDSPAFDLGIRSLSAKLVDRRSKRYDD